MELDSHCDAHREAQTIRGVNVDTLDSRAPLSAKTGVGTWCRYGN